MWRTGVRSFPPSFWEEDHSATMAMAAVPEKIKTTFRETIVAARALLEGTTILLAQQRTNIWDEVNPPRSMLLGAYTSRSVGISTHTDKHHRLTKILNHLSSFKPKSMRHGYCAIAVNQYKTLKLHKD
eukprot:3374184-Amphidinium_carterae.1